MADRYAMRRCVTIERSGVRAGPSLSVGDEEWRVRIPVGKFKL